MASSKKKKKPVRAALKSAALSAGQRYGEKAVAEAKLEPWPNPEPARRYLIEFTLPEFTCLCPRSGFPDFATLRISYVPAKTIVELKSLKLYINGFRGRYISHEGAVNEILSDLVQLLKPVWIEVVGDFNQRGNIKTIITARHGKRPAGV